MNQRIEDIENMPLYLNQTSDDITREQAIDMLMAELKRGEDSIKSEADLVTEEEVYKMFGVKR